MKTYIKKNKKSGYITIELIVAIFVIFLSVSLLTFTVSNINLHIKKNKDIQLLYDIGEDILSQELNEIKTKKYEVSELSEKKYVLNESNVSEFFRIRLGKNKIYVKEIYVCLFSKYNLYRINLFLEMGDFKINLNTKARFLMEK